MKKIKIVFLAILALVVVIVLIPVIGNGISSETEGSSNSNQKDLATVMGISEEDALEVNKAFESIGIADYQTITYDSLLDGAYAEGDKGYRLNTKENSNIIVYVDLNGKLNQIRYADTQLYAEGQNHFEISDFNLTNVEMSDLKTRIEKTVEAVLKAPSTAKFPNINVWRFGKTAGVTTVQSYVDSQNGFGAMIRSEFQVQILNNEITSFILEGKEYITK